MLGEAHFLMPDHYRKSGLSLRICITLMLSKNSSDDHPILMLYWAAFAA